MPELLGRHTSMPVTEVVDGVSVGADRVYVAPPGFTLEMESGRLRLVRPAEGIIRATIDHFFRSLAADQKERAIGIILSGAGSDGTLGLKEIKAASGMVMVQDEASAKYAGMPHSAIATALVDYIVPIEDCADQLLAYVRGPFYAAANRRPELGAGPAVDQIVALLRGHTGNDFSSYKESTLRRRIERRMNVHRIDSPDGYVRFLQENPGELSALFRELLIGVTSFFRDPEAFAALGHLLDKYLADRPRDEVFRVWDAGCATGEEAYSTAILLRESADRVRPTLTIQVFATDLDGNAIEAARTALFPDSIAADVPEERLERFFNKEEGGYRVKKEIRDLLVFASHNLLKHPPFTKVDLIVCRNVLIYLNSDAQASILPLFHHALRPHGILFLGPSETLGRFSGVFEKLDPRWKLFARLDAPASVALGPAGAGSFQAFPSRDHHGEHAVKPKGGGDPAPGQLVNRLLLEELVPPSVLVNERGDVVHLHGKTGRFLEPAAGQPSTANVLQMARPGLELHLAAAIRQAAAKGDSVRRNIKVQSNGDLITVDVRAHRVESSKPLRGLILVSFELVPLPPPPPVPSEAPGEMPEQMAELRKELELARENHQVAIEELETTNEELTSTNEELQSTNEELQSANEELETSREEMQSLNEELQTLNSEMQSKLDELSRANDDMQNLLNSTDVAVLFLDDELNVKRYTLQATKLFNLIPSDVGRPIADLVSKLDYERMLQDADEVLRTAVYREIQVRSRDGDWYLMRILPYRTQGGRIGGLVFTLFDITKVRRLEALEIGLQNALERLAVTVLGQDRDLRVIWAHAGSLARDAASLHGKQEADFLPAEEAQVISTMKRKALETGTPVRGEVAITLPQGRRTEQDLWIEPVRDGTGTVTGLLSVAIDLTERRQGERTLRELRAELDAARQKLAEPDETDADLPPDSPATSRRTEP